MASGWIHAPGTLARNTRGAQVTAEAPNECSAAPRTAGSSVSPRTVSMPSVAGAAAALAVRGCGCGCCIRPGAGPGCCGSRLPAASRRRPQPTSSNCALGTRGSRPAVRLLWCGARIAVGAQAEHPASRSSAKRSMNRRRAARPGGSGLGSRSAMNDTPALQCGLDGPAGRPRRPLGERHQRLHEAHREVYRGGFSSAPARSSVYA